MNDEAIEKLANSKGIKTIPNLWGCCKSKTFEFENDKEKFYSLDIHEDDCFESGKYDIKKGLGKIRFIKIETFIRNLKKLPNKSLEEVRKEKEEAERRYNESVKNASKNFLNDLFNQINQ